MTKKAKIICSSLLSAFAIAYLIYSIVCFKFISEADIVFSVINQILLWFAVALCIYSIIKPAKQGFDLSEKITKIVFWGVSGLAIFLRVFMFTMTPPSLAPDELSMLYESYSLANFGIDRNGHTLPVYLEAWGSGQNALLAYLTIPFVKIFGMNAFSARIVSLLISTTSLFVLYLLIKKIAGTKLAFICFVLFSICPWNLIASRWGLESNLFPALVIFAFYFLVKAIKDNHWWLCLSTFFFGLALYSYAISFMFVPLFLIVCYAYMLKKHTLKWQSFIVANVLLFMLAFPLIGFVFVNYGWVKPFKIFGVFSVPKLGGFRASEFNLNTTNIVFFLGTFIFQNDFSTWNMCFSFGITYLIGVPLMIIGFVCLVSKFKNKPKDEFSLDLLFFVWFVLAIVLGALMGANINKINIMWIPMFYFVGVGANYLLEHSRRVCICLTSLFAVSLVLFCCCYYPVNNSYNKSTAFVFNDGLIDATKFIEEINDDELTVYVSNESVWEPYIYVLVASGTDTQEFTSTVVYEDPNVIFRKVLQFANYKFGFTGADNSKNNIYIVKDGDTFDGVPSYYQNKKFGYFTVFYASDV